MHWSKNSKIRDAVIKKLSESLKGRISPRKGVELSEKTKEKISQSKVGVPNLKKRIKADEIKICNDYQSGESALTIEKKYKINYKVIYGILERNGFKRRTDQEKTLNAIKHGRDSHSELQRKVTSERWKGKNNPRWSGGRYENRVGYVMVHDNKNRWRPEHRVVAEKIMGRELKRSETIHHINEIKNDNRQENLYYFQNDSLHKSYHGLKNKPILISNFGKIC